MVAYVFSVYHRGVVYRVFSTVVESHHEFVTDRSCTPHLTDTTTILTMAEINAIVCIAIVAIELGGNCRQNTRNSNRLIKCLQAVKDSLEPIDSAEHDRIQVSHENTLRQLKYAIKQAHALLEKQTKPQNPVLKCLGCMDFKGQFDQIQIQIQAHLQTLNLSVGVFSEVQMQKIKDGLNVVKWLNREALIHNMRRANRGSI
jgi:hypothetical protein